MNKKRQDENLNKRSLIVALEIICTVVLLVLSVAMLANAMSKPLGRDEHMYCTAGVLLAQGKMIYRDFCHVAQLPYHPLLLATLYKLSGTTHYLLVGRLTSVVCDVLVMVCIVIIFQHAFRQDRLFGRLFGLCGALLYAYNPVVDYANGYAWNNDFVVLCVVFSFLLYVTIAPARGSKYWRAAGIGAVLGVATWMRMTTVLYLGLFALAVMAIPAGDIKGRAKLVLAFLTPVAIVSIWPVSIVMRTPRAFFIDVFRIHAINSEWLRDIEMVFPKFRFTFVMLMQLSYLVLFVVAVYLLFAVGLKGRREKIENSRNLAVGAALPVVAFVIALGLPTIWRQYLAPPVPMLIIAFAYPLAYLQNLASMGQKTCFVAAIAVVVLATVLAAMSGPDNIQRIGVLGDRNMWTPVEVHLISQDIAEKTEGKGPVLTTAPLFVLEGGGRIYPEFSAGVFPYRIDELMSEEDRLATNTVGLKGVPNMLTESPPAAVLVGVEQGRLSYLEDPFIQAIGPDWRTTSYSNGLALNYRP